MKTRLALVSLLALLSGCATSTRVRITTPEKTVEVIFPKNLSAEKLDFDADPVTGQIRFRSTKLRSDASKVIESATSVIGEVADAALSLSPLAK
jgi:hypothetical protein